ncbi:MAG: cation diffusion facilitator family transporter [Eubacteriaceae bacterium]
MLISFIQNKIKSKKLNKSDERKEYGYFSSLIGILLNIFLFVVKLLVGLFSNSISLIADSINNLSDTATGMVGLIGFKISVKPADREHPFGHGRTEYISSLIVSFIILVIGYELMKDSIQRIINPTVLKFNWIIIGILIITILIKLWLGRFYLKMSQLINSKVLKTASVDCFSDVWSTSSVLLSFLISKYTHYTIDGYTGCLVALFIIYNGYKFVRESFDTIIGDKPDKELIDIIKKYICSYDGIINVHEIIVHDYGPVSKMATAHVEISSTLSLLVAHEIIDTIERNINIDLGVSLLLHMDPVEDTCKITNNIKEKVFIMINSLDDIKFINDFRVIEENKKHIVLFQLILDENTKKDMYLFKKEILEYLNNNFEYTFIINLRKENHYM